MICVVKLGDDGINDYIVGEDLRDVSRQAKYLGFHDLEEEALSLEYLRPGKHELDCGWTVLG